MGLSRHALEGTILPNVSIDEFEAKSGSESEIIVVALYAIDEDPAKDLDTFVEMGPYDIIDVDVSPNPDDAGNYLIFLEFKRNIDFWQKLDSVLEDIINITGDLEWQVSCNVLDYDCTLNDDELRAAVVIDSKDIVDHPEPPVATPGPAQGVDQAAVESYISESLLISYTWDGDNITIRDGRHSATLECIAIGESDTLIESMNIGNASMIENSYHIRMLRSMFGYGWNVNALNENIVISGAGNETLLVVKYLG